MINLLDAASDVVLGSITEDELQLLIDSLEETSPSDTDYFIDQETLELIAEDERATKHLLTILQDALAASDGLEVRWEKL